MKRPLQLPLAIALALGGTNALALGLGPVHVKSKLNQPLEAEIPVIQGAAGEAEGLLVSLAAAEDFERVGISRSRLNVPLEFTLVKGANGQSVIRVTSQEPVRDAYLDFLVEANWPKGRLLREYTVLLDPPVTAPARRTATTTASAAPRSTTTQAPRETPREAAPVAAKPAPQVAAKPAPPASAPARKVVDGEYGPVAAGETLSEIARATRPDTGVDINQIMLALLKSNPDAFYKDNVNALKRGAILRVPSAEEIRANASASAAATEIQAQIEDWRGGRASPTRVADAGSSAISAPPAAVKAASAQAPNAGIAKAAKDSERLELVPPKAGRDKLAMADQPGSGTSGGAQSAALKAELARAKEALTARDQESGELKSRVDELEEISDKNQRLISLKDSEIAELQQKLKALREQAVAPKPASTSAVTSAPATTKPVAPVATTVVATPAATTVPAAPIVAIAPPPAADTKIDKQDIWGDAGKEKATTSMSAPGAVAAIDTVTAPPVTPASSATSPSTTLSTVTPAASPTSGATVTPLPATPPTVATTGATPAKPAAAAKPAQGKPVAKPVPVQAPWYDAPWVKPAAIGGGVLLLLLGLLGLRKRKADPAAARGSVAGAFGESTLSGADGVDAVAAEAAGLREMLRDDPANVGLHLELLSIYYAERDVANFEDAAAEMHIYVTDTHQPEWLEAQAMGQELAPHNPLFSGVTPYDDADAEIVSAHDDTAEFPAFDDAYLADDQVAPVRSTNEYNFGDSAIDSDTFAEVARAAPSAQAAKNDEPFDFGDLPPLDAPADAILDVTPEAPALARLDDDYFPGEDAIGTKLDLAKAYMDMGDPDGARSMLEEVVAEGSDTQKAEAHRLIVELG